MSLLLRLSVCVFALAATGSSAGAAYAPPWSPKTEYALLRQLPEGLYPSLMVSEPDARGFIGYHRETGRWYQAGYQRGGARHFFGGIMAGDRERMAAGWRAIEVTFEHQIEDGGFLSVQRPNMKAHSFDDRVETAYFFLQALNHALLVLRDSPFEPEYRDRVAALRPKIVRATEFVLSGYDGIVKKVGHTANRLFIAAKAIGMAGVLFDEERYRAAARKLAALALERRDAGGVFIEREGRDSSYNAVSILMGQELALYLPSPELDAAFKGAMVWQLSRIAPDGDVLVEGNTRTGLGQETGRGGVGIKKVNTREVGLALIYHAVMYGRPELVDLGARVARHGKGAAE